MVLLHQTGGLPELQIINFQTTSPELLTQIQYDFAELFLMVRSTKIFTNGSTPLISHSQVSDPVPKGPLVL